MSKLENANLPLIGSLMQDIALKLDQLQQWNVAAWAVKTIMVMEAAISKRSAPFYDRIECSKLRLSLSLPDHTKVWLARYVGINHLGIYGTELWEGGNPDDQRAVHGYAATIFVGCLAIQVLTLRPPRQNTNQPVTVEPRAGPWERLLVKIWPAGKTVDWPPSNSFADRHPFPWPALVKRWSIGESID